MHLGGIVRMYFPIQIETNKNEKAYFPTVFLDTRYF